MSFGISQACAASKKDKERAEVKKAAVDKRISSMQAKLSAKQKQQEQANAALKQADQAISQANLKLRSLRRQRQNIERELRSLSKNNQAVSSDLLNAEDTVNTIARAQFLNSRKTPWQSLIGGQNPSLIARDQAFLAYLGREELRVVNSLERKQNHILSVTERHRRQQRELRKILSAEEAQHRSLLRDKTRRQKAIDALTKEIRSGKANLDRLKRDQARLGNVVAKIERRLRQQAAAAAKKRKAQQDARRKALAAQKASKSKSSSAGRTTGTAVSNFARLKGRLTRPSNGRVVASFGARRANAGGRATWQGIRYKAPTGSDVKACAPGEVVFNDWMRGFGNLLIIDHGHGYMSVYANNESTIKNVGDRVKQGETIGTVGSSGGQKDSGLYFELRHKGKPINPKQWLKR